MSEPERADAGEPPVHSSERRYRFLGALPEALFLALLTVGAYWFAFCYEAGYLSSFGLPKHLVQISLQNTFAMLLNLKGYIFTAWMLVEIVVSRWPTHPRLQFKMFRVLCALIFFQWQLFIYEFKWQRGWSTYLIWIGGLWIIMEFILPLLAHRDKPFRERFIASENADALFAGRWFAAQKLVAFSPVAYRLLVLYIVGGWFVHMAGSAAGETQKEYFVLADAPDFAVVRTYSDTIIAVQFDRKTKALQSQVIVRKLPKVPSKPQNPTKTPKF